MLFGGERQGRITSVATVEGVGALVEPLNAESTSSVIFNSNGAKGRIVVAVRDPLTAKTLSPVVNTLSGDHQIDVYGDGSGIKMICEGNDILQIHNGDILARLSNSLEGALVAVVCQSENAGIDMAITATAKSFGIPVVALQDTYGVLPVQDCGSGEEERFNPSPEVVPDYVCVMSKEDKELIIKHYPQILTDNVIVTGSPARDHLSVDARLLDYEAFREKYEIGDDEKVIVWVGQIREANTKSFKLFVEALKKLDLGNCRLAIGRHPKDETPIEEYEKLAEGLKLIDTTGEDITKVSYGGDLVVSMFSTVVVDRISEGGAGLFIMIPELMEASGFVGNGYDDIPQAFDGSVAVVRDPKDMEETLRRALLDEEFKAEMARKAEKWISDGKATERVMGVVEKAIQSKPKQ